MFLEMDGTPVDLSLNAIAANVKSVRIRPTNGVIELIVSSQSCMATYIRRGSWYTRHGVLSLTLKGLCDPHATETVSARNMRMQKGYIRRADGWLWN